MIKVDMHVHSDHSRHPSEWFLQRIGASESYTPIEEVYRLCKQRGMDFVTLTDHNTIDGAMALHAAHPDDTFISVEVTTYFPEDGCKVHVLCYAITPEQFTGIQERRHSIYTLRDYLREQEITCSVAHATYSVNGRLRLEVLEKLILLFDVFEGINGARNQVYNSTWLRVLQSLTPNHIHELYQQHGIEPWGEDSWIKGFTGGSDDHSGLMIGETFTMSDEKTIGGLLERVRQRETHAGGRHGNHKTLAFSIYKIAHEYSKSKMGAERSETFISVLNQILFEDGRLDFKSRLALRKMKRAKDSRERILSEFFEDLTAGDNAQERPDARIDRVYDSLSRLSDSFFTMIVTSLEKDLKAGDTGRLLKNIAAALPAVFLAAPFFTTMRHLHHDRQMLSTLEERFGTQRRRKQKRILWFSDTVVELNGVAVTMNELARTAAAGRRPMKLVTSLAEEEDPSRLPPNTLNLPCIYHMTPDFYSAYTLRVPSLLQSLDIISEENPDEIVISTPGPVGLLGLAVARLMDIKCTGIYHTDFRAQVDMFIGDEGITTATEGYTRFFFRMMDEVRVPTNDYMERLAARGIDRARMKLFHRGIDPAFVVDDRSAQQACRDRFGLGTDPVLMWAGRLGREKNLDVLMQVYGKVQEQIPDCHLLVAGDGPELARLQDEMRGVPRVHFAGRTRREDLVHMYTIADVFVFPSTTDTFGMVVLEAQACGLPVLVTDVGGPQELVVAGETGYILRAEDLPSWVEQCCRIVRRRLHDPSGFEQWRESIRQRFQTDYGWERVLDDMMGMDTGSGQTFTPDANKPSIRPPLPAAVTE